MKSASIVISVFPGRYVQCVKQTLNFHSIISVNKKTEMAMDAVYLHHALFRDDLK